jgi:predicted RNA-binding Zn-ribbon protein involved in translation (DUF1610 family)
MGRSRHLNVDCARSQEAYFAKIRTAAQSLLGGETEVSCPREGCIESIHAIRHGGMLIINCPACGVIYRGSSARLLEYFD